MEVSLIGGPPLLRPEAFSWVHECACRDTARLSCALPAEMLEAPKMALDSRKSDVAWPPNSEIASSNAGSVAISMLLFDPVWVTLKVSPVRFPARVYFNEPPPL